MCLEADEDGFCHINTHRAPCRRTYAIPDHGPVDRMLEAGGRSARSIRLHFIVNAPLRPRVTHTLSQEFVAGLPF